ncbi:hypothetical protein BC830DRAFT_1169794 [Chytriomyces sp. MP71]|nr:hypothetical protein BC830DRAFT_1169794 [Chytriomyces sp. MP71]
MGQRDSSQQQRAEYLAAVAKMQRNAADVESGRFIGRRRCAPVPGGRRIRQRLLGVVMAVAALAIVAVLRLRLRLKAQPELLRDVADSVFLLGSNLAQTDDTDPRPLSYVAQVFYDSEYSASHIESQCSAVTPAVAAVSADVFMRQSARPQLVCGSLAIPEPAVNASAVAPRSFNFKAIINAKSAAQLDATKNLTSFSMRRAKILGWYNRSKYAFNSEFNLFPIRKPSTSPPTAPAELDPKVILVDSRLDLDQLTASRSHEMKITLSASSAKVLSPIRSGSSAIACGLVNDEIPHRYCLTHNIALHASMVPKREEVPDTGLDLPLAFGGLETSCGMDEDAYFLPGFGGGASKYMFEAMNVMDPVQEGDIPCDAWVDTPVFFISRWDTTNPYQFHQDALNTFIVYSLLDISVDEIQPVILDRRNKDGPYTTAWSHIFTSSKRLIDIRQLTNGIMMDLPASKKDPRICFKKAVWGMHGGISPLAMGGKTISSCSNAPLIEAFREFMLSRVRAELVQTPGLHSLPNWLPFPPTPTNQLPFEKKVYTRLWKQLQTGSADSIQLQDLYNTLSRKILTITYAIRGATTRSNTSPVSPLSQVHGNPLHPQSAAPPAIRAKDPSSLSRTVTNDDVVQSTIQNAAYAWSRKSGVNVEFRAVDFAKLPFEEQIAVAQGTDYFIGAHGAAFIHLLYLRRAPRSTVLELKPPERASLNFQFHNLAHRMGHGYEEVKYGFSRASAGSLDAEALEAVATKVAQQLRDMAAARGVGNDANEV